MVLSKKIAIIPATNGAVRSSTLTTWLNPSDFVPIASGLSSNHWGIAIPVNNENPKIKIFRELERSQYFKFEIPTPVIKPNMTQNKPPITGSGIVTKNAENFDKRPKIWVWNFIYFTNFIKKLLISRLGLRFLYFFTFTFFNHFFDLILSKNYLYREIRIAIFILFHFYFFLSFFRFNFIKFYITPNIERQLISQQTWISRVFIKLRLLNVLVRMVFLLPGPIPPKWDQKGPIIIKTWNNLYFLETLDFHLCYVPNYFLKKTIEILRN